MSLPAGDVVVQWALPLGHVMPALGILLKTSVHSDVRRRDALDSDFLRA